MRGVNILNDTTIKETNTLKVNKESRGNFFIMDSEQVISNPYQDLQTEALDSTKKNSLTERLTAVRNNVCEHNLKTKTSHLERQRTHKLRDMHMDTSNLRYERKVMDINRRRNELAIQKRIDPDKDFSYDTRQINNTAKRLGVTSEESFYLNKSLQFPLRSNISKDHNAKPFIKKARSTMLNHTINKKAEKSELERAQTSHTFERATTAHTVSTTVDIPSPEPFQNGQNKRYERERRGSKSAPIPIKHSSTEPHRADSRLSTMDEPDSKLPSITTASVGASTRQSKSHVKFLVQEPAPFRQSTPDRLYRSKTYYSGMGRTTRSYSEGWDSDSDDDYLYCDKIDLRELFFGNKSQGGDTKSAISGTTTPRTVFTGMSSEIPPSYRNHQSKHVTEEQVLQENREIRDKIDKFLGNIKKDQKKEEKKKEEKKEEQKEADDTNLKQKDMVSKAAVLLSVFSKPVEPEKQWGYVSHQEKQKSEAEEKLKRMKSVIEEIQVSDEPEQPKKKNMWELIKTNVQSGNIHRKYTANDLLLQQLTGILVQSDKKPNIPIHSASRALRHTPTFKMRRVVEELMKQRTRFEQQEVEKLQKQDAYGEIGAGSDSGVQHYPPRAWATPTKQLEQNS